MANHIRLMAFHTRLMEYDIPFMAVHILPVVFLKLLKEVNTRLQASNDAVIPVV